MKTETRLCLSHLLFVCLALLMTGHALARGEATDNSKKLKIVFLMGQSNMVGYSRPETAWYLTQPIYLPPPKTATARSRYFDWSSFYWSGIRFAYGDSDTYNAEGAALIAERSASRKLWRARVYGNFGRNPTRNDWKPEWGPPVKPGQKTMIPFLHKKAEEEGIYRRMVEHIESPENKFHPTVALKALSKRDELIADDIRRVREIFLKGTQPEDFDGLVDAIKAMGRVSHTDREAYVELVKKHVNLPIAERTWITAYGEVAGEATDVKNDNVTQGVLSLGYAKWPTACGPEYPFGISFERLVDGPLLIVKCAWGGTSLDTNWRPPSLATDEKPIGPCLARSLAHIKKVLADPGKYHPDYDPEAGYELAGLVWFQGWNDNGNKAYGQQLVHFIKDFRKELNAPELPVVCGLLGHAGWKQNTFDGNVNSGMLYAARHPDLEGTVDVVNTVKYMPIELGLKKSVEAAYGKESTEYKEADRIIGRATSKDGTHYFGSAKFIYLTGDAMARKLANLLAGGEPSIHKEAEAILHSK